jgi:ATP-dependent DNA helicase DinG
VHRSTENGAGLYTPASLSLPSWVKDDDRFQRQLDISSQITDAFESVDTVFLQAPTGTGKTLIAKMVQEAMDTPCVYCCTTKALQDQFAHDFTDAKVLKGRANYLTDSGILDSFGNPSSKRYSDITCADCTFDTSTGNCRWCLTRSLCPYVVARTRAIQARLAVLNTSYLLTDLGKGSANFAGRGLLVLDEADVLDSELLNHIEVVVTKSMMKLLSIQPPRRKTVESAWMEWVEYEAIPNTTAWLRYNQLEDLASADDIKTHRRAGELLDRLLILQDQLPQGGWVYDGYDGDEVNSIIFRPIHVGRYGDQLLWPHADKTLLMSATILSPTWMADDLGINTQWEFIDVPSTFPVANRPIYVTPVADMSYNNRHIAWPEMVKGVEGVVNLHPDERVLVHTVSYDLARYLADHIGLPGRPVFTYTSSDEKAWALTQYKRTPGAVLLAASMDRGIDLPDDLCRVQVVAKIPFPNIKDKRINARMYSSGGSAWYKMQAIRTLIQMTGRGVRSAEDHATTYILDAQFGTNLWKSAHLFPTWWKEALTWKVNRRMLLGWD